MAEKGINMTRIENNRIKELKFGEHFNVLLHNGDNPSVNLTVDFEDMPLDNFTRLAWNAMKVTFRPHVKGMTTEKFKATFDNKVITWREMVTKEGARSKIALSEKTPDEVRSEIARLQGLLEGTNVGEDEGTVD